jgi:hypothetical protein
MNGLFCFIFREARERLMKSNMEYKMITEFISNEATQEGSNNTLKTGLQHGTNI